MKIGIIGLGAMGMGMAKNLIAANHQVKGFDINQQALINLIEMGGEAIHDIQDIAKNINALLIMVVNAEQTKEVLFAQKIADNLSDDCVIVISSTMSPKDMKEIGKRLVSKGKLVLDAPVSGGKAGADSGQLTIMASGSEPAFQAAQELLDAISKKVYRLGDDIGLGSTYKVVHQLAAGVHLAVMAEIMVFGVKSGCDPDVLYDIVCNSAGQSWMFKDRTPYLLKNNYTPRSAVDIFVKDLSLVMDTGKDVNMPLPLASIAQQLFIAASSSGYGKLNDAAIVKVYEDLTGVNVANKSKLNLSKE